MLKKGDKGEREGEKKGLERTQSRSPRSRPPPPLPSIASFSTSEKPLKFCTSYLVGSSHPSAMSSSLPSASGTSSLCRAAPPGTNEAEAPLAAVSVMAPG
jgi:hypothetical protein